MKNAETSRIRTAKTSLISTEGNDLNGTNETNRSGISTDIDSAPSVSSSKHLTTCTENEKIRSKNKEESTSEIKVVQGVDEIDAFIGDSVHAVFLRNNGRCRRRSHRCRERRSRC
ncbi:hypothetical protein E3N88_44502 [Mikania micrantha]|uniref:Uncharacterized protein n=1 Tax=Mikania micrantha TaxID=192012 RepID=A0A5N6LCG6_9ASTR|nr:hypothetical protein E3N88_44502 [Mikania micrantha]